MTNVLTLAGGAVAVVALLALSAFFSSSEIAVFSLPREWIDAQAATGEDRAVLLEKLLEDPHRLLVTLLVGNNIVNIAISSIVTVLVAQSLPPGQAVVATTVLGSVLILLFGEIVPKAFGLANAKHWSLTVAAPVSYVELGLSPVITLFDGVTRRLSAFIPVEIDIETPYLD